MLLKNMFSNLKHQFNRRILPRARLSVRGGSAVVYRRWFGVDIVLSERSQKKMLPSLLEKHESGAKVSPKRPVTLVRKSRVTARSSRFEGPPGFFNKPIDVLRKGNYAGFAQEISNKAAGDAGQVAARTLGILEELKMSPGANVMLQSRVQAASAVHVPAPRTIGPLSGVFSDAHPLTESETKYIETMRKKETFGGSAEVFALSQILGQEISIYLPTADKGLEKNYTFSPLESRGKIALRLKDAHYEPFVAPPSKNLLSAKEAEAARVYPTVGDGQCLFNAVAQMVGTDPDGLRSHAVDYIVEHAHDKPHVFAVAGMTPTLIDEAMASRMQS